MIRTILAPITADATDSATLWTTLVAARQFDAHIEFLFVRSDPAAIFQVPAPGQLGSWTSPAWIADLEREEGERLARARRLCQNFCDREQIIVTDTPPGPHGMSAAWHEEKGDEAWHVTRHARLNDLLIVPPPSPEHGLDADMIATILIGSGRPVLLAPVQRPDSLTRTIVIAWKETPEAARAVMAAMPFLVRADKVIVLSIGETDAETARSAEGLAQQLRWHRLEVEARCLESAKGSAPETLIREALDAKTDLIVMGGYSRSRVRELIFGGFTQHVLNGTGVPVLLCH